jgi:hypothetical protein
MFKTSFMKKISVLVVALATISGTAMAQNNSDLTQNGIDNEVIINQMNSNNAIVFQGDGYTFYPAADEEGTATGNLAEIDQSGNNLVYIGQGINEGSSLNSEAYISQTGNNYADVFQGVLRDAVDAYANITQNGSNNQGSARQSQVGFVTDVDATITQNGNSNYASILQGVGGNSESESNEAEITQQGSSNASTSILQGSNVAAAGPGSGAGFALNNSATITITGSSNGTVEGVRINQGINGGSSENNTGLILQEGNFNDSIINQGVGNGTISSDSEASVYQYSNNNMSTVNQNGASNSTLVTQD